MERLTTLDLKALVDAQIEVTSRLRSQLRDAQRRIAELEIELAAAKREVKTPHE